MLNRTMRSNMKFNDGKQTKKMFPDRLGLQWCGFSKICIFNGWKTKQKAKKLGKIRNCSTLRQHSEWVPKFKRNNGLRVVKMCVVVFSSTAVYWLTNFRYFSFLYFKNVSFRSFYVFGKSSTDYWSSLSNHNQNNANMSPKIKIFLFFFQCLKFCWWCL